MAYLEWHDNGFICYFRIPRGGDDRFHWDIWLVLAVENWIFDFGRPIVAVSTF